MILCHSRGSPLVANQAKYRQSNTQNLHIDSVEYQSNMGCELKEMDYS